MDRTIINCEPSAGLYIEVQADYAINEVSIESILLNGCGYCCYDQQQAALIVLGSAGIVTINNVAVHNSNGSGIYIRPY